jgi:hypothetical protein
MCTVSIVAAPALVRLVVNRDEQRTRPQAVEPCRHHLGTRHAVYPIDPIGPGTWVGVNDAGVAAALLNVTAVGRAASAGCRSRGLIVPAVLDSDSLEDAVARAIGLPSTAFSAFRLIIVHRRRLAVVRGGGGERPRVQGQILRDPLVFASSSLGDRLVEPLRQTLFADLSLRIPDPLAVQQRFHRHQWAGRPHLSVLMARQDARTVSCTRIDLVAGAEPVLAYRSIAGTTRAPQEFAWAS